MCFEYIIFRSIHLKDTDQYLNIALDSLHKSKIVEEFLGETKLSTAAYIDVREERRRVSTPKLPTRLTYAGSLFTHIKGSNVADVVSASRKLHFKSPEAWLAYQKEFGNYVQNDFVDRIISPLIKSRSFIADSIVSNLNILGQSIGAMESMGCNPELMLQSIKGTFTRELQELAIKDPAIRPPSKLACAEGFEGDTSPRTAAYSNVREDSSTASTYKSPAEVELGKRSNKAKPFVKWVGGKRSLIKELSTRTPQTYKSYYEPFIGGAEPCCLLLLHLVRLYQT